MTAMPEDPDRFYRPLEGPEVWAAASDAVDKGPWAAALAARAALGREAPAWSVMAGRGAQLAAAYQSGSLAGLYPADDALGRRLAAGVAAASGAGAGAVPHMRALDDAASAAAGPAVATVAGLCRLHATACHPQLHHLVQADEGTWHDHVLGHGDLKHHPNHRPSPAGGWVVRAPVAMVVDETGRLAGWLGSPAYAALHPAGRAAYALHAFAHVGPFAAGNGRVGRAVATAVLLDAAGLPLWVPAGDQDAYRQAVAAADAGDRAALVVFVVGQAASVARLALALRAEAGGSAEVAALARWEARVGAARRLAEQAATAARAALLRHSSRTDLGWLSGLAGAVVTVGGPVRLVAPVPGGATVSDVLTVDPHPLEGDGESVVLRATEAELGITARCADIAAPAGNGLSNRLDDLLDRVVTALALRAAAASD